jgi:hypothetical protein
MSAFIGYVGGFEINLTTRRAWGFYDWLTYYLRACYAGFTVTPPTEL